MGVGEDQKTYKTRNESTLYIWEKVKSRGSDTTVGIYRVLKPGSGSQTGPDVFNKN